MGIVDTTDRGRAAVVEQSVVRAGLYPVKIPALNAIGYQLPTVPGGAKIGDFINGDLDDAYEGSIVIECVADNVDKLSLQVSRPVSNYTTLQVTLKGAEGKEDLVGTLTLSGTTYSGTIADVYNNLMEREKDVVVLILEFFV
jgi:hypothetical protein